MNDSATTYSNRPSDYQKVRTDTLSLINAASNRQTKLGNDVASIGIIYPAENLPGNTSPVTRKELMSAEEILSKVLDEQALAARIREITLATPISYNPRKNAYVYLDVEGREYTLMQQRLMQTITAACQNFRKEATELLRIYDGFTQAATGKLPSVSTYHIYAAFENADALEKYRLAAHMPAVPAPSLTPAAREELQRRGVKVDHLPDYSEQRMLQGLMYAALPANAEKLRQAAQDKTRLCEDEVLIIMRSLNEAMARGAIQSFSMDDQFRAALGQLISAAHQKPATVVPPKNVDLSYAQ